eukprot:gnl/MRDRNA2_/MRDRNA2_107820_c0_seq1.p1 gnl/MRDRNA2_/MRDRNA2_107820_c0~~gnl/MRDRNA2_/MRDRNA2_107820_c0_seq1.p1  ORF type:complete len:207 (-),score=32.49 gnl/MRDRNA2_/MRDRNA2_107820_c0_seq1:453-1073(-)
MDFNFMCNEIPADFAVVAQAGVGLWIWSVWSWRLRMETQFRGGIAKNLVQEFQTYGYPIWVMKLVGIFKMSFSGMLVFSIIMPIAMVTMAGAGGMVGLMLVAIASHFKVGDQIERNGAAAMMLLLSAYTLFYAFATHTSECFDSTAAYVPWNFRRVFGGCVAAICLNMWYTSYKNGDYNTDSYDMLDESLLKGGSTQKCPPEAIGA